MEYIPDRFVEHIALGCLLVDHMALSTENINQKRAVNI